MTGHLTEAHHKAQKQEKQFHAKAQSQTQRRKGFLCAFASGFAPLRETLTFYGYTARHAEKKARR
jgi:hypothetical protein